MHWQEVRNFDQHLFVTEETVFKENSYNIYFNFLR
jgi:hypothetical protein